jgi:hypothetical protein
VTYRTYRGGLTDAAAAPDGQIALVGRGTPRVEIDLHGYEVKHDSVYALVIRPDGTSGSGGFEESYVAKAASHNEFFKSFDAVAFSADGELIIVERSTSHNEEFSSNRFTLAVRRGVAWEIGRSGGTWSQVWMTQSGTTTEWQAAARTTWSCSRTTRS